MEKAESKKSWGIYCCARYKSKTVRCYRLSLVNPKGNNDRAEGALTH